MTWRFKNDHRGLSCIHKLSLGQGITLQVASLLGGNDFSRITNLCRTSSHLDSVHQSGDIWFPGLSEEGCQSSDELLMVDILYNNSGNKRPPHCQAGKPKCHFCMVLLYLRSYVELKSIFPAIILVILFPFSY